MEFFDIRVLRVTNFHLHRCQSQGHGDLNLLYNTHYSHDTPKHVVTNCINFSTIVHKLCPRHGFTISKGKVKVSYPNVFQLPAF